jgi:hypothetical protein
MLQYACTISVHSFKNALAYFATVVSHACKVFMNLTPWARTMKLFMVVIVAVS